MTRNRLIDLALGVTTAALVACSVAVSAPTEAASTTTFAVADYFTTSWTSARKTLGTATTHPYQIAGATTQEFTGGRMYRGVTGEVVVLTTAELRGVVPADGATAYALDQQGDAYKFGADGTSTWDCSSLVQRALRFAGKSVPRTSDKQHAALTRVDTAKPGDILWWPGHVGIYVGVVNGKPLMITATWHRYGGVVVKGVALVDPTTRAGGITYEALRTPLR